MTTLSFAWRLLHLPPKNDKPFKIYKHSRTLPILESTKSEKNAQDEEESKTKQPYKSRIHKTLTEPIEEVPKLEKRKPMSDREESSIYKPSNRYTYKEEGKSSLESEIVEEPKLNSLKENAPEKSVKAEDIKEDIIAEPVYLKPTLKKSKSLVSKEAKAEKTDKYEIPPSPKEVTISEEVKPIEEVKLIEEVKPIEEVTPIEEAQAEEAVVIPENNTLPPEETVVPPEEALVSVEETTVESVEKEEPDLQKDSAIYSREEETIGEENIAEQAAEQESYEPKSSEDLPNDEKDIGESIQNFNNPTEASSDLEDIPVKESVEIDESTINSEEQETKEDEPFPMEEDPDSTIPKTEETLPDTPDAPLEEPSKDESKKNFEKGESIEPDEDSNVIIDYNDTESSTVEGLNKSEDTGVTITQIQEDSETTTTQVQDEGKDISYTERTTTSEFDYSREETVIHAVNSIVTQNSEILGDSDKSLEKDLFNETEVTTDEENLES